ncbi:MAG: His/Gly/Thr/Pro-type tRNA ligase C-terminal domain-containing protein [Patescibacteria group bacterium]|nr:His/Gly/Thr/Pro-type tRNA ligase C-terminal domain-containing protein [Patescibacteria group bacterium]
MKYSQLFGKTRKTAPHDAESVNAKLLSQAGFIEQMMAGVYAYLPLGLRVLNKIKNIVRQEMNAIGGQEMLMPALQSKELWSETGRWEKLKEIMFQFKSRDKELGLATTHEEPIVDIARRHVNSYKDLPFYLYQIQDKFRNEPRAKSGLLRGREFSMKDLYSFHCDEQDLNDFYAKATEAYKKIFTRCGLEAIVTQASGGEFTNEYSHEFQVVTPNGEDTIFHCASCGWSQNKEIAEVKDGGKCPSCGAAVAEKRSIEVGNIFKLGTRYSHDMKLSYTAADGKKNDVIMGCFGIGPSRVMGSVVEVLSDERGIIWPKSIAPYLVHIVSLFAKDEDTSTEIASAAANLSDQLAAAGIDALWDDREGVSAGEKLGDADLIGAPLRIVISDRTMKDNAAEWKFRQESEVRMVSLGGVFEEIENWAKE